MQYFYFESKIHLVVVDMILATLPSLRKASSSTTSIKGLSKIPVPLSTLIKEAGGVLVQPQKQELKNEVIYFQHKGCSEKKWTRFRGCNSRSIVARAKRSSSAKSGFCRLKIEGDIETKVKN